MRVSLSVLVLLAAVCPATAAPVRAHAFPFEANFVPDSQSRLQLPGDGGYRARPKFIDGAIFGARDIRAADAPVASGLSIGPIHTESELINGHCHVHYRVEGLHVLGGDIGASIGGHGAMLLLRWPPSEN